MQTKKSSTEQNNLPIFKYKNQIVQNINKQSVLIISGLTGCGKSTQVPQYLLDAYPQANIAVCEPRRLAATSLALRVCQQRKTKLSSEVGYQIGLQTKRSDKTRLVYMTYGILIQELLFKQKLDYDFIILDEVHERSLEMDFAFVILKKILNRDLEEKIKTGKMQQNSLQKQQSNKKNRSRNLKLLIMSATLNSEQFQKYFAVHNENKLIIQPEISIKNIIQESTRRKRGTRQNERRGNGEHQRIADQKKQIEIKYTNFQDYREAKCVFIEERSPYIVREYFLQDFLPYFDEKVPSRNYEDKGEVRLEQRHYDWGLKLIEKTFRDMDYIRKNSPRDLQKTEAGDILVFLPGLIEINKMKEVLVRADQRFAQKIVEVHSLFSQDLYYKLFKSQVKNKIILATNIGETSITLPNCKVVIDYCLNRKALKNTKEGISRFSTALASLSNLIQRKGRVGRVSDGIIYRLITKEQYQSLDEFDVPEIKCVSLQMSILKTKKLESTSKSHIFEDIYNIFLNVLQPPEINSIEAAVDSLIHEDALQYVPQTDFSKDGESHQKREERRKISSGKKFDGKNLKITKVGQFMVSMPCDLSVSKLILMGIKLGIPSIIIDIAAIILSTKSFFCHEERRFNIEEFMHSLIGYDKGDNNDYLLRQRLFDHWRSKFYVPYRQSQRSNEQKIISKPTNGQKSFRVFDFGEEVQFDENYRIVESFVRKHQSEEEKNFCKNRGVYANHMRQLLRLSETLKIRIETLGVQRSKLNTFQPEAELVLICLMYAFPDIMCEVRFQFKNNKMPQIFEEGQNFDNKLIIPIVQGLNKQELQGYLQPQKDYEVKNHRDSLIVSTYDHVLKKFLLPKHYTKAHTDRCSLLYNHSKSCKIKYPYQHNVHYGFSNITILNESINKEILISRSSFFNNHVEKMYLISNNVIESKGRYMVGANALLSHFQFVIISMIVKKNVEICLHPSGEFFSHIQLNEKKIEIPLLLTEQQVKVINKLRSLSKRKKQEEIASYKEQFDKEQLQILSNLFRYDNTKIFEEQWEQIFIEQQYRAQLKENEEFQEKKFHNYLTEKWIPIEFAENKIKAIHKKPYYQKYNDWKKYIYESTERQFKLYSTTEAILICGLCNSNKDLIEVASAYQFQFDSGLLKLNRYSGSWICPQSKSEDIDRAGIKIFCSKMHHIGISIDSDYAQIDIKNIHLYVPFNKIYPLKKIEAVQHYKEILNQSKGSSMRLLRLQHEKFQQFECKICFSKLSHRKVFLREELSYKKQKKNNIIKDPLWGAVINHISSNAHLNNKQKLKRSICWN